MLTFLYTQCPDVCPLTAARLRTVYEQLGADVSLPAVSVDPEQDTVAAAYDFSDRPDLLDRWSFLVGDRQQLEAVWKDYFIGVRSVEGDVLHNAPIHRTDPDGRRQLLHPTGGETDAIIGEIVFGMRLRLNYP